MNYHKIEKTSVANGTGIRVVLWVSGCSLHCKGCHNPETWSLCSGKLFDEEAKRELFEALDKPYIQGITFSGGHPLEPENAEEVLRLCKEIKERFPTKDIWLYTGYTFEEICEQYCNYAIWNLFRNSNEPNIWSNIQYIDVLVDGKFIEEEKDITLLFRGSKNQRLIDIQKTIHSEEVVLYN